MITAFSFWVSSLIVRSRNIWSGLAQADCGDRSFGSRRKLHVKPVVAKLCNTEADDLVPWNGVSWLDQRFLDRLLKDFHLSGRSFRIWISRLDWRCLFGQDTCLLVRYNCRITTKLSWCWSIPDGDLSYHISCRQWKMLAVLTFNRLQTREKTISIIRSRVIVVRNQRLHYQ